MKVQIINLTRRCTLTMERLHQCESPLPPVGLQRRVRLMIGSLV